MIFGYKGYMHQLIICYYASISIYQPHMTYVLLLVYVYMYRTYIYMHLTKDGLSHRVPFATFTRRRPVSTTIRTLGLRVVQRIPVSHKKWYTPPENSQRKPSEKMMLGGVLLSFLVALFVPFSGAKLLNFRGVLFATELGVPPIQNGDTLIYEHNFPSWIEIQSTIPSGKRCCNSRTKIGH